MDNAAKSKGLGTRMRERFKRSNEEQGLWERPPSDIPLHPGKVLKRDFLEQYGISARELADALHVRLPLVRGLLRGERRISAGLALRLACCFDTEPRYWLSLQDSYSLATVWAQRGETIEQ